MSTQAAPTFNADAIGKTGDPVEFEVTQERIAAYAAATNDSIAAHAAGEIAPPVFAIVPAFQAAGMASLQVIPGELLGAILHGEQAFEYFRWPRVGDVLEGTSEITDVYEKERSNGGKLEFYVQETMWADQRTGEPVVKNIFTLVINCRPPKD